MKISIPVRFASLREQDWFLHNKQNLPITDQSGNIIGSVLPIARYDGRDDDGTYRLIAKGTLNVKGHWHFPDGSFTPDKIILQFPQSEN
jgi:hypothetical protein